jgi:peroxin-14
MSQEIRQDLVSSAVGFLRDPKVQEAPLTKRVAFLESKGLTQAEIQAAISQSTSTSAAPVIPPRGAVAAEPMTWKDVSFGILGVSGLVYGAYVLLQVNMLMEEICPQLVIVSNTSEAPKGHR